MTEATSSRVADDVMLIVGGNFTVDCIGPRYEEIRTRARANPRAYLQEFESLFLRRSMSAQARSNLFLQSLLGLLADLEPERVRQLAGRLVRQYEQASEIADGVLEEFDDPERVPLRSSSLANRLRRKRDALRHLAGSSPRG